MPGSVEHRPGATARLSSPGRMDQLPRAARQLAEAKSDDGWLAEAPGHCLQQTLMDLDKSCRTHGTFRVRWRSGRRWRPSFRFPEGNKMVVERLNRRHGRVKLPKLGWVKFRLSRPLDGLVLRSAKLTRDGTHWFVSFLVDDGRDTPAVHERPGAAAGVDRGVITALAISDGQLIDREFLTHVEQDRVVRLQRRLSRCERWGCNRTRRDFCAQAAHRLATANAVVVLEDLKTRQMTRSAKEPSNSLAGM
jgi:putative transposase